MFRRAYVQNEINIGDGTEPASFQFENNQWFSEDRPLSSKPSLPAEETGGIYGSGPRDPFNVSAAKSMKAILVAKSDSKCVETQGLCPVTEL